MSRKSSRFLLALSTMFLLGCDAFNSPTSQPLSAIGATGFESDAVVARCRTFAQSTQAAVPALADPAVLRPLVAEATALSEVLDALPDATRNDLGFSLALSGCLNGTVRSLVSGLDRHPESSLMGSKFLLRDLLMQLVTVIGPMKHPIMEHLATISLGDLLKNPELVASMASFHPRVPIKTFESFAASISSDWRETPLASLVEYAYPNLDSIYGKTPSIPVSDVGPRLAAMPSEWGRSFLAEVYVSAIFRHGYFFSAKGKAQLLADANRRREDLERILRVAKNDGDRQAIQEELRAIEAQIALISGADFSIAGALTSLVESAEASGIANARTLFQPIVDRYSEQFSSEYQGYGYRFREGDVFANISSGGLGNLFMNLAQLPNLITHSGVFGASDENGVRYYFTVEISGNEVALRDATLAASERIFLRSRIPLPRGTTDLALANLARFPKVHFDYVFEEGMLDRKGNVSLYCAELVHYFYQKRFEPTGPNFSSPFDSVETHIDFGNSSLMRNAQRLGINVQANFFPPDSLLYSADLEFNDLGIESYEKQGSDEDAEVERFRSELRLRMSDDIVELFRNRELAPVPLLERMKIEAGLIVLPQLTRLEHIFPKLENLPTIDLELPPGEAKFHLVTVEQAVSRAYSFMWSIQRCNEDKVCDPDWKAKALANYEQNVLSRIAKLFE